MTNRKESGSHYARTRKELATALGYDVDRLTAAQELRLDNVVALKLVSDTLRAALLRGEQVDHRELLAVTDGLQRLLPREREPEAVIDDGDDPHENLMRIIEDWIDADKANKRDEEAERRALGLPANELEAKDAEIAALKAENARLRGLPAPEANAEPERTITPSIGDITPPSEIGETYAGKRLTPDDLRVMRPKPVIDGTAVSTAPTAAEREAKRQAINNDRSAYTQQGLRPAGGEPWRGHAGGVDESFFWGGSTGKRAW